MLKNILVLLVTLAASVGSAKTDTLIIYSSYEGARLAPIFAPFTQRTGIQVEVVNAGSTELIAKLQAEGESSSADLYLDKDLTYMGSAAEKGLLQPFTAPHVFAKIPKHLIDAQNNWFLLFYRSRTIMYNTDKVSPADLSTYEDLGNPKWKGQLCVRTANHSYNEALGAHIVKHYGEEKAERIFKSWVANFAFDPINGDTDLIKAIASGRCTIGIANTYYLAPLVRDDASFPVRPFFADQNKDGAHINGVGIGITEASKKLKEANLLLEYLTTKEVQEAIAGGFSQYPSSREASLSPILKTFGPFVEDTTNVGEIATFTKKAKELMQKAGYK